MKRLWFHAKRYGWGWTPATWEGWLVLAAYLVVLLGWSLAFKDWQDESPASVARFVVPVTVWTALLIGVCWKTGETPCWRWGGDEKTDR